MKILHIITSLESGGAERMLSNIVNNDNSNQHIIITLLKSKRHYELNENVKVISLDLKNNIVTKIITPYFINKIVKKIKPDILQTWMKSNLYAPILKYLNKNVITLLNFRNGINKKYNLIERLFLNKFFEHSDGTIFVSESSYNEYRNAGLIFNDSIVIPNGFMMKNYKYKEPNKNEKLTFGYVGRYHKIKNQELLIEGFNEFSSNKNVELKIAGKGMSFDKFSKYINRNNKNKFAWYGEMKNPFELYDDINVLILTSKSEGFPNVIGEAMSIGVPVVTTDAGESYKIIGETGYKIQSNINSLLRTLNYIYAHQNDLNLKSQKAYKRINDNFSMNVIVNKYLEYYKQKLEDKQ